MTEFQNSILINRPTEDVFAVLSDPENEPKWQSRAVAVKKISKGPIGMDSTWSSVVNLLGRQIESNSAYTEFEEGWKYTVTATSGPFAYESQVTVQQVVGLTQVSITADMGEGGNFFKLGDTVLATIMRRQIQADLVNLKDLMEARAL